jgi:hypothetical protein
MCAAKLLTSLPEVDDVRISVDGRTTVYLSHGFSFGVSTVEPIHESTFADVDAALWGVLHRAASCDCNFCVTRGAIRRELSRTPWPL